MRPPPPLDFSFVEKLPPLPKLFSPVDFYSRKLLGAMVGAGGGLLSPLCPHGVGVAGGDPGWGRWRARAAPSLPAARFPGMLGPWLRFVQQVERCRGLFVVVAVVATPGLLWPLRIGRLQKVRRDQTEA